MKKLIEITIGAAVVALLLLGSAANAYDQGDWLLRVGVGNVDPKSTNGDIASVDSGTALVFNGTYFFTPNLGFEILAASPFSHDIELADGGAKVGETKHLPPTFSLNYHFDTAGAFKPYVGAGLNYTLFFDEDTEGATTCIAGVPALGSTTTAATIIATRPADAGIAAADALVTARAGVELGVAELGTELVGAVVAAQPARALALILAGLA